MSNRGTYTTAEWATLQFAPLWVFTIVAGADKTVDKKEMEALAKTLASGLFFKEALASEVLTTLTIHLASIMEDYNKDARDVLQGLRDVASLLGRKATSEQAEGFKRAMLYIGTEVAKASGATIFHRDPVSNEEKAALVLVAMALDVKL